MGINFENVSQEVMREVARIELSDGEARFNEDEQNELSRLLSSGGLNEDEQAYVAARRDECRGASVSDFDKNNINGGVVPNTTIAQSEVFTNELLLYYVNEGSLDGFRSSMGFPEGVIGIQSVVPSIDFSDRSNDNVVFENDEYKENLAADSVGVSVRFIYQDPDTGKQATFRCEASTRNLGVFEGTAVSCCSGFLYNNHQEFGI